MSKLSQSLTCLSVHSIIKLLNLGGSLRSRVEWRSGGVESCYTGRSASSVGSLSDGRVQFQIGQIFCHSCRLVLPLPP